jgi:hypothetical protein
MSINRYVLLSTKQTNSHSQVSLSKVCGIDAASRSQCGSMTSGHGKVTLRVGLLSCFFLLTIRYD